MCETLSACALAWSLLQLWYSWFPSLSALSYHVLACVLASVLCDTVCLLLSCVFLCVLVCLLCDTVHCFVCCVLCAPNAAFLCAVPHILSTLCSAISLAHIPIMGSTLGLLQHKTMLYVQSLQILAFSALFCASVWPARQFMTKYAHQTHKWMIIHINAVSTHLDWVCLFCFIFSL